LLIKTIINDQVDVVVVSRYLGNSSYKVPIYALVGEFFIYLYLLYRQQIRNNQGDLELLERKLLKYLKIYNILECVLLLNYCLKQPITT